MYGVCAFDDEQVIAYKAGRWIVRAGRITQADGHSFSALAAAEVGATGVIDAREARSFPSKGTQNGNSTAFESSTIQGISINLLLMHLLS